jgi:hypothetical protein
VTGASVWRVLNGKAVPANALATTIAGGCASSGPPTLTGSWSQPNDPGAPAWTLTASGPGLSTLKAAWQGGPGPHASLVGSFQGTLNRVNGSFVYSGKFQVSEGSVQSGGTMSFRIVSKSQLLMSYVQTNGPSATNIVFKRVGAP